MYPKLMAISNGKRCPFFYKVNSEHCVDHYIELKITVYSSVNEMNVCYTLIFSYGVTQLARFIDRQLAKCPLADGMGL